MIKFAVIKVFCFAEKACNKAKEMISLVACTTTTLKTGVLAVLTFIHVGPFRF